MINNEFHIIGTAITNFVETTQRNNHKTYNFRVEVEKMGSKRGETILLSFNVYSGNKNIDFDEDIEGCQVVVNGYLDSFVTEKGNILVNTVVQSVYVVSKKEFKQINSDDEKYEIIE